MLIQEAPSNLFSLRARKRFGRPCPFGLYMFGLAEFGDSEIFFARSLFGDANFGDDSFCDIFMFSGIFQTRHNSGSQITALVGYMIPKNPRTEAQQAQRTKLANAVAGWQSLTTEQKNSYNERAKFQKTSGYNLYLKEYLLSN